MYITQKCNFVKVEVFESKDRLKQFHHAHFLADDIIIKCPFIKKEYYDILVKGNPLSPIEVVFNLEENGVSPNGDKVYTIRLHKINGWLK